MSVWAFVKHRIIAGIRDEGGVVPASRKAVSLLANGGLRNLVLGEAYVPAVSYAEWVDRLDSIDDQQRQRLRAQLASVAAAPKISVLVPTFNTPISMLEEAVESVKRQLYPNWELCIADDASTDPAIHAYLSTLTDGDQIKVVLREANGHISAASNSALAVATGDWIVALDHDDTLAEDALHCCAMHILENPRIRMIYSDEDKLDSRGKRARPYFKPSFNRELLRGNNYICHLACYRRDELLELGGFREGFEGAQDHDLALRYSERLQRDEICHIQKILYHWREHAGSTAVGVGAKKYALRAGEKAVADHLERSGLSGSVSANARGYYTVQYALPDVAPSVCIIIPTRNSLDLLRKCVESILSVTTYPNYKVLVIDNGSTCTETLAWLKQSSAEGKLSVLRDDGPFNYAALNNRAVEQADADFVVLLNNDTEVISPEWLSEMVATAEQPDVCAVGAKLLYPDNSVQHCGVVMGIGGSAGHAFKGHPKTGLGYYFRAVVRSEFSAVTGACLLVRRGLYLSVGGLDAARLRISFNDIDFCLRLHARGYRNVVCPDALLYHFESKTRGYEDTPEKKARFAAERSWLRQRWLPYIEDDPAYNSNLSRDDEHFSHERRFSPQENQAGNRTPGDDDFDYLLTSRLKVSAGLILLLKRVCYPPERSVGIAVFGRQATQLVSELKLARPSARTAAVTVGRQQSESAASGAARATENDQAELPYPVDLVIVLDEQSLMNQEERALVEALRSSAAIVHYEEQYRFTTEVHRDLSIKSENR